MIAGQSLLSMTMIKLRIFTILLTAPSISLLLVQMNKICKASELGIMVYYSWKQLKEEEWTLGLQKMLSC